MTAALTADAWVRYKAAKAAWAATAKGHGRPTPKDIADEFSAAQKSLELALESFVASWAPVALEADTQWLPIKTAPRDGRNILIRFGRDGVSQAKFIPGLPHPWLFIDTNDGITWLLNHAVDGMGGPSHWTELPL